MRLLRNSTSVSFHVPENLQEIIIFRKLCKVKGMGDSVGLRGKRCELNFADRLSVSSSAVLQKVTFNVCNYCHAAVPELEISTVLFAPRLSDLTFLRLPTARNILIQMITLDHLQGINL